VAPAASVVTTDEHSRRISAARGAVGRSRFNVDLAMTAVIEPGPPRRKSYWRNS